MGKIYTLAGILLFGFIAFTLSCTSEILCEPVVVVSSTDYFGDEHNLPYGDIHDEFAETYSGKDLSVSLRNDILEVMETKADSLGEDPDILYECAKATCEDWSARPTHIPCYAEKCLYNDEPVWAIAFNGAYDYKEETLGHLLFFYVSCSSYEVLYYDGFLEHLNNQ
jgi:hypothetical protein